MPERAGQSFLAVVFAFSMVLSVCAWPAPADTFRPAIAVLPWQNLTTYGGALLGRRAADQMALDLGDTGAWRVLERAQTDRACRQRELTPPYAVGYLQELSHALGADLVCTGLIQAVEIEVRAGTVRMKLYAEMMDQVSGQLVVAVRHNVTIRRNLKDPEATDVLVSKALAQAGREVAQAFAIGPRVQGEVAAPGDGKTVPLSFPPEAKLQAGQRVLLYRPADEGDARIPGRLIGAALVVRVEETSIQAEVLAHSGDIHTGDLAVTVGDAANRVVLPDGGQR